MAQHGQMCLFHKTHVRMDVTEQQTKHANVCTSTEHAHVCTSLEQTETGRGTAKHDRESETDRHAQLKRNEKKHIWSNNKHNSDF